MRMVRRMGLVLLVWPPRFANVHLLEIKYLTDLKRKYGLQAVLFSWECFVSTLHMMALSLLGRQKEHIASCFLILKNYFNFL